MYSWLAEGILRWSQSKEKFQANYANTDKSCFSNTVADTNTNDLTSKEGSATGIFSENQCKQLT